MVHRLMELAEQPPYHLVDGQACGGIATTTWTFRSVGQPGDLTGAPALIRRTSPPGLSLDCVARHRWRTGVGRQVELGLGSGVAARLDRLESGHRSSGRAEHGELVGDLQALAPEPEQRRRATARPSRRA